MFLINQFLMRSIILTMLLSFQSQAIGKKMSINPKYNYQASESAPINYPMKIISASLTYHDKSGALSVPSMVTVANGWGEYRSSHVTSKADRPLPGQLSVTFFSFLENQFYKGEFSLPIEKISELFGNGFYSYVEEKNITFNKFIIGISPGGFVTVWLNAYDRNIEVFTGEAKKIEGDWRWITDNSEITRKEYIKVVVDDELSELENINQFLEQDLPFNKWKDYSTLRYNWSPVLTDIDLRDNKIDYVHFYTGEKDYLNIPLNDFHRSIKLAVPDKVFLTWSRTGYLINDLVIKAYFDEKEIFSAFNIISKDNLKIEMEFRMEPDKNYNFTIWVRNEKNSIELKKTKIKTWKPGGMRYKNAGPKDTE